MKKRKFYFRILRKNPAIIFFSGAVLLLVFACNNKQETGFSVMSGPFRQSVIETGELQAVNASSLIMPRINYIYGYNLKLVGLAEHGKTVHKGDPVIQVDPSSVQKFIIEKRELLETEKASTNKLQAQLTNNLQDIKAQLRNEQASYDIKKLGVQKSGFESAGIRKVMELEFRQAEIRLNKLKRNLELRPKLDSLDLRIQKIRVMQKENEVKAALDALKLLTVLSPLEGIFVVEENWNTGQIIKVGDAVYTGEPVAKIPDIRSMKVKGFVQENDIGKIKSGINVIVRLDALPSVPFHGKINKIGLVCIERDKKKVFPAEIVISESDLRLKPGMTVSCEYITYENENDLYVPNNCILQENRHCYVFVRKRGAIRKTEVKTGPSNNNYTVISGDIKPGQSLELPENILTK